MERNSQWFFKNSREEGHSNRFIQLFTIPLVLCLVAQSWPTLCDPMDCSPPGSAVHGDSLQARILEWVAMLSPWDFPNPGPPALQVDSLPAELHKKPTISLFLP